MASPGQSGSESHSNGPTFSLENILGNDHDKLEHPDIRPEGWDEEDAEREVAHGYCIECEDQPAQVRCETCSDDYCEVCFSAQHRKGSRKKHTSTALTGGDKSISKPIPNGVAHAKPNGNDVDMEDDESEDVAEAVPPSAPISDLVLSSQPTLGSDPGEWFVERAKYIPLRLTLGERKYLRLLDAALQVSEYTDKIDTLGFGLSKAKRIVHQIRELCAILSGLVLAADYKQGQELFTDRDFASNSDFYQKVFELGRRHKIMNPDKMRTTYGKLVYLLQDSQAPEVREMLGFTCVAPIRTVHEMLDVHGVLDLLRDPLITTATQEINAEKRSRREIQRDIRAKERAIETLSARYRREPRLPQEMVRQALYSIGDNHAFLRTNRDPCDRMIGYLQQYFHPTQVRDKKGADSLAIRSGRGGARLSHDHARQYVYVMQSLALWREILHDMFHLWSLAEQDLLSETISYRLRDTGQGLNRVQGAPKTSHMMHAILNRAQKSLGGWVGSSVIHMGDHNVPNALMFIDKYSQIYRILLPICNTLSELPMLYKSPALRAYIDAEYGSLDALYLDILGDFFRHAFDGSGADNFYDAGSCIDGRLTSAWNWCSSLEKKHYFHVFLLAGFNGFDGEW
ncbi:hypothetical protein DFH94DRAFT_858097 [Russula ochroleuca]|uniref:B box-type domain-containing protein n=1 Tax=Russula ochroleuca TaxID=152965 RepID=A0A9P5JU78_9AGAM|nr:hypothetical protein DFH94DRAFT_858097 [Russula ochroleuca]